MVRDTRKRTTQRDRLEIILSHEYGESISSLSRRLGYSRNTVRKVIQRGDYRDTYIQVASPVLMCGTNAAYWRHKRAGERPCLDCYAAHAAEVRAAKLRTKGKHDEFSSREDRRNPDAD